MKVILGIFAGALCLSVVSSGYVSRTIEVGEYGGKCTYDEDCSTPNSFCKLHKKCDCKSGYKYDSRNDLCLPTQLGLTCTEDRDCSAIRNSRCDGESCQCENGHGTLNSKSECIAARQVMADCQSDDNCQVSDANTMCNSISKRCECVPTYHQAWNSQQCVPNKQLRDVCTSHEECVNVPDQKDLVECRTDNYNTKKCLCRPGVEEVNNVCTKDEDGGAAHIAISTALLLLAIFGLSALN